MEKCSRKLGLPRKGWLGAQDLRFYKDNTVWTTNEVCFEELVDSTAIKFYCLNNSIRLYQCLCSEITCFLTLRCKHDSATRLS